MKRHLTCTALTLVAVIAVVLSVVARATAVSPAAQCKPSPIILPPHSRQHGAWLGEWGARWWQWALSIPSDVNPVLDTTGEFAGIGQSGPVFFLAGSFVGSVERTVTIPEGKTLFFPILNTVTDNINWSPPPEFFDYTVEELYDMADDWVGTITNLYATIDGVPVKRLLRYRGTCPRAFPYWLPEGNIYQYFGLPISGLIAPAVSDGYWLMIAPLPPGEHEIAFGGGTADWSIDIVYHITVAAWDNCDE